MTEPGVTTGTAPPDLRAARRDWWRDAVVYQIYPRSFADSDGDGVGDLPGIIDRLDYLEDGSGSTRSGSRRSIRRRASTSATTSATTRRVDPVFGTEADFDRLVAEAHRRGIRLILDLVLNHTSDRHAWFEASRASRDNPHADWYLWRDPAGTGRDGAPLPPNNWVSFFGGRRWTWEPRRGQFYQHTFLAEQPDLNWRNPAVEAAQLAMVRGWLERGVDGFRLDVFNVFLKHPDLPSNPVRDGPDRVGTPGPRQRPRSARLRRPPRAVPGGRGRRTRTASRSGSCSTAGPSTRRH